MLCIELDRERDLTNRGMASSKVVMVSTSTTNADLPRQSSSNCSISNLISDFNHTSDMDDLLKNIYSDDQPQPSHHQPDPHPLTVGTRTVDDVWNEIVAGGSDRRQETVSGGDATVQGMTLEDFLTKAGAVREEDVRVPVVYGGPPQFQMQQMQTLEGQAPIRVYGNGTGSNRSATTGGVSTLNVSGRGKRRVVELEPLDKATQQKQRRMIKNRESAARSRERKQAYTVELESLVTQLEEENARLSREVAEQEKDRLKQLMENLIPVIEKRRPPCVLRRVRSVHW